MKITKSRGKRWADHPAQSGLPAGMRLRYIHSAVPSNPIHALLVSASLGALIGLVRQWEYEHDHPGKTARAGLRTFTAWSLMGCASALLAQQSTPVTLAVAVGAFMLVLGAVHIADGEKETLGLTTFSVGLVTFALGAMAAYGMFEAATVTGVGAMLILGSKPWSQSWTRRWKSADLGILLQFAAITGIVLPLAPNEDMGPYSAFNPYKIWLMVVMVACLGFLGYLAVRWLGERAGLMVTGLAGGLASSTVTTLAMSRQSRDTPKLEKGLALAAVLACAVMLARVVVMLALISPPVARAVLGPFALMALPGAGWAYWQWRRSRAVRDDTVDTPTITNPLSLTIAIKFGVIYAVVRFLVKMASGHLNPGWVYAVSFVSGLTGMDAIAISSAQAAAGGTLDVEVAANCIIIGALSNTLMNAGMAAALGTAGFRRAIVCALGAVFVAGLAGMWLF